MSDSTPITRTCFFDNLESPSIRSRDDSSGVSLLVRLFSLIGSSKLHWFNGLYSSSSSGTTSPLYLAWVCNRLLYAFDLEARPMSNRSMALEMYRNEFGSY
ncbi:hypothetical protein OGAPHI_002387 [Ogataea philodendri]|uniref:Uncharacterized protein n=1 Tax=Ogataea philodendri TaxID=1378263 RepID=A0A9P8PAE7_9ASCO|nr:uncharacterized protein OGAPHI_002387 [Ogataea philodendri]KAH3668633.1 hypothetical protein OGAPHI_002387 [Ogataea philodendri]